MTHLVFKTDPQNPETVSIRHNLATLQHCTKNGCTMHPKTRNKISRETVAGVEMMITSDSDGVYLLLRMYCTVSQSAVFSAQLWLY